MRAPLDGASSLRSLPFRPAVRRFARAIVRELRPLAPPVPRLGPRLLALFIDGLAPEVLARAGREGLMRLTPALRDSGPLRETRAFSGMPSSTAPFQAGLFYGLAHPDVPGFTFHDRASWQPVRMYKPHEAERVEARVAAGRTGLLSVGGGYLTILRGGSPDHTSTASMASILDGKELPRPELLAARALVHPQSLLRVVARVATEAGGFLSAMARHILTTGVNRHEWTFLLNHALVGTLGREVAISEMIVDLVRGAPLALITLHDYDEAAHRRGPGPQAEAELRSIDEAIEILLAVASEVPDPPEAWIFTDHGQIAAVPFEKIFGCKLEDWLRGARDGGLPPTLPEAVVRALGPQDEGAERSAPPVVTESGNFAHVYFERGPPLDGRAIAERHGTVLARALSCPGVGMVVLRSGSGAMAFSSRGRIDPQDPATVPKGASPRAVAALLADLPHSPSSGDLVLYGAWFPGGCVSFAWEFSSHGGVSPVETETFVIHPTAVRDPRISHGADLHRIFQARYTHSWTHPRAQAVEDAAPSS